MIYKENKYKPTSYPIKIVKYINIYMHPSKTLIIRRRRYTKDNNINIGIHFGCW